MDGAIERAKDVVEAAGIANQLVRPQRCSNERWRHCWESLQGEQHNDTAPAPPMAGEQRHPP